MNTKKSTLNTIAVMSSYVFTVGMMAINPTIQKLIEAYPEVPVSTIKMVSTLPSLISSFLMIITGFFLGRKLKYKPFLLFSLVCIFIGGILPIVWNSSFYCILAARALFGVGMAGNASANALVIATYDEHECGKYLGYGVFVSNICGVLMQVISGFLADIGLKQSFYVYFIAIIPFLLILFFLKEPESAHSQQTGSSQTKEKITVKPRVWLYIAIGLIWCILGYSIMTNMSTFIKMRNIGEAGVSGSILALYTLGGAIAGAFAAKLYQKAGKFFVPFCFATAALGELLVLIGLNIPMLAIGTALAGAGWFALIPNIMAFAGKVAGPASSPFCTSAVKAFTQIGVFLSSYLCAFLGRFFPDAIIATKYCAIIGFGLMAIIFLFYDIRPASEIQKN
ncbi:MAG: MFS transporter [Lachnospiraceae bacterium]